MKKYKLTVIVPSYNNGAYLEQCLESILNQKTTFLYQIIITDDCSTDNSVEIIKEYEKRHPEKILALYSDTNCKLFKNQLKALEKLDSEYYCVLDPDDYYTDMEFLQKAVDFLEEHDEYTIYATNLHILYEDGTCVMKYERYGVLNKTSTYEDFLKDRAVFSCTPSSVYRNIYFDNGIPQEFAQLKDSIYREGFRGDTARNLIHLKRGKIYYINESNAVCRDFKKGLWTGMQECEKYIQNAFARIGYYTFFGEENLEDYAKAIYKFYKMAIKAYYKSIVDENIVEISKESKAYFRCVSEWLIEKQKCLANHRKRIPFSLNLYGKIKEHALIIWGTGLGAQAVIETYHIPLDKAMFVDNNKDKQGSTFLNCPICAPDIIKEHEDCLVVIASSYYKEIIEQIREMKLCEDERILNIFDYKENWLDMEML